MFGSTILEVAIGVVFVYLLLSLLCSALGELIESFVKFRARDLEKGIKRLLEHPKLAREFFNHPLIKPLGESPSYIPARTFSLALWNLATAAATEGKQVTAGLMQNMDVIRGAIASLDDEKYKTIKTSLLTLIDEAGNDVDKARANIEEWYNDAMDRVSGWYKRRMQWMLIVTGLLAAAILNVDTITVTQALWYSETLRGSITIAAENYLETNPAPGPAPADTPQDGQGLAAAQKQQVTPQNPLKKINDIRNEIDRLGLPIGWVSAPEVTDKRYQGLKEPELSERHKQDLEAYKVDPRRLPQNLDGWLLKALGLFLTALAVSQGAPFWFDLLNKFIVVRSTVKPREKSREQPSKDRPVPESTDNQKADEH